MPFEQRTRRLGPHLPARAGQHQVVGERLEPVRVAEHADPRDAQRGQHQRLETVRLTAAQDAEGHLHQVAGEPELDAFIGQALAEFVETGRELGDDGIGHVVSP